MGIVLFIIYVLGVGVLFYGMRKWDVAPGDSIFNDLVSSILWPISVVCLIIIEVMEWIIKE